MLRANYTDSDQELIEQLRYSYPDARIMRRFEILCLHSHDMTPKEIAPIVGQCYPTVCKVITMFQKGGIDLVTTIDSHHPTSDLATHQQSIVASFTAHPPATAKEAASRIKQLTGVERSPQRVRVFMEKIGMKFRKTAAIPAKADVEKQEAFRKEVLEPELEKAKAGESVLLFMDGVHFVLAAFLGGLWCFQRIFVRSPSGRQRWNVLGAFNPITGQLTSIANDGYITATTVCELLRKVADQYAGCPIVIVLDNARYQHCKAVESLALELGITLKFLPSYSPNLNLIERLWKFVKKKCLNNVYYENFGKFTTGINDCLSKVGTEYKEELSTLMKPNFQDFKKVNLLPL